MTRSSGLAVVLVAAACAERPYPGPPEVTLGFGDTELVPIEDGDPVPITMAPQGGTIVWGAAAVRYLDPHQLELRYSITPPEGRASLGRVLVDLEDADGGFAASTALAHPVFLPDVDKFSGLPCVFRLEARDRDGRVASDEKMIVPPGPKTPLPRRDTGDALRLNRSVVSPARDREALDQAIARGSELLKQNKLDQAMRAFNAALELAPDNTKVLALLGLAQFRAGQLDDARPIYEELVKRAPTDASHHLNLGLVYLKLGDGDRAINALEASRALDPSQGRAVSYLGLAYARAGRYAEAYRSFLLAGQNELASEIEVNLTAAERDGINHQLGRTPPTLGPHERPTPPTPAGPTQPIPSGAPGPTQPMPTISLTAPEGSPTPRSSPAIRRANQPSPPPPLSSTGRAITQNVVSRAVLEDSGRIPVGEPRSKPPSTPPTSRNRTPTVPVPPMSAPEITIIHDPPSGGTPTAAANLSVTFAKTQAEAAAAAAAPGPLRMSESQQFVLPNRDPAVAPLGESPRPLDGRSMVSMAVAAAVPTSPAPVRTATGGTPPRPLSELATEALIRPDDGTDVFEVTASGALIIRVGNRVLTRLDGVHVTGGDLAFEVATRRSRGHQTEERFDFGGTPLHAVSGTGYLIAVPNDRDFAAVVLDDDILYLREDLVFAFESTLRWENGNVPGLRGKLPVVQFRGDGAIALRMPRPLVRVKLTPQALVLVDAARIAGWIGRVIPRAVVPPPGSPMGAMCIECSGEGVVLVEPSPQAKLEARTTTLTGAGTAARAAVPVEPAEAHRSELDDLADDLGKLDD